MEYTSSITIELLSMFRWERTGWQSPVNLLSPDATITLGMYETASSGRWTLNLPVERVEAHNEWVDESMKDKVVGAVVRRCQKDAKIVQMFGQSLRNIYIDGIKRTNMFYPTDFMINPSYKYRFIVALDGDSMDKLNGVYLLPSYLPAPRNGLESDQLYKMCCYERF